MTTRTLSEAASASGLPLWAVCAVAFAAMLSLALLALLGAGANSRRAERSARIEELHRYRILGAYASESDGPVADETAGQGVLATRALAALDQAVRARGQRARLVDELERSGLRMRPEEWAAMQIAAVVGLGALVVFVSGSVLGVFVGGVAGWLGCRMFLRIKTKQRRAAFETALPDALQLLAGALRSGFALNQSIGAVVREGIEPVAGEFGRVLQEVRLGAELVDGLDAMAQRMDSSDMGLVVMSIRTSREVGGNLAEVLQTTVATMRERVQLRGQVKVLTAEGRLSAKVLTGLPIAMTLYLRIFRPDYLRVMYTTGVGIALLVVGAVLLGLGSLWLSRLTKIEV